MRIRRILRLVHMEAAIVSIIQLNLDLEQSGHLVLFDSFRGELLSHGPLISRARKTGHMQCVLPHVVERSSIARLGEPRLLGRFAVSKDVLVALDLILWETQAPVHREAGVLLVWSVALVVREDLAQDVSERAHVVDVTVDQLSRCPVYDPVEDWLEGVKIEYCLNYWVLWVFSEILDLDGSIHVPEVGDVKHVIESFLEQFVGPLRLGFVLRVWLVVLKEESVYLHYALLNLIERWHYAVAQPQEILAVRTSVNFSRGTGIHCAIRTSQETHCVSSRQSSDGRFFLAHLPKISERQFRLLHGLLGCKFLPSLI